MPDERSWTDHRPLVRWLRARFDGEPAFPDEARLVGEAEHRLRDQTRELMGAQTTSLTAPGPQVDLANARLKRSLPRSQAVTGDEEGR